MKKLEQLICIIFFISLLLNYFSIVSIADETDTYIYISPEQQIISPGESFSFDVICDPGNPVRSYELKLVYDASLIQVVSVSEGLFFDGFPTFFSNGTIDNNLGRVTDVFNLILGPGNVSSMNSLITVSCVATDLIGQSTLDLYDVGVTNETMYLPLIVEDGFVSVQEEFLLYDMNPSNNSDDVDKDLSSISLSIEHISGEMFNYSITTNPDVGSYSESNQNNGTKTCSISDLEYDDDYEWIVSVQNIDTGEWFNRSFLFSVESEPHEDNSVVEIENNPPVTPLKPIGSAFIEPGENFSYSTQTYDPDGDLIRYRFRWGDNTFSNWTTYNSGDQTVTLSNRWFQAGNFSVQVIAQDEHGLNSSWSEGLTVVCSFNENDSEQIDPVADFSIIMIYSENLSYVFNASMSYDADGNITNYYWDFGDGTNGSGVNIAHIFLESGWYNITLFVSDNDGNICNKTLSVFIDSMVDIQGEAEGKANESFFLLILFFSGFFIVVLLLLYGKTIFSLLFKSDRIVKYRNVSDKSYNISKTFFDQIRNVEKKLNLMLGRPGGNADLAFGVKAYDRSLIGETDFDVTSADSINGRYGKNVEKPVFYEFDKIRSRIDRLLSMEKKMDVSVIDAIIDKHGEKAERLVHNEFDKIRSRIDRLLSMEKKMDISVIDAIIDEHEKKAEKLVYNEFDKIRSRIDRLLSLEKKMDMSPVDAIIDNNGRKAEKLVHSEFDRIREHIDKLFSRR